MQILFTDETNVDPSKSVRFFVYGGLLMPVDVLPELDERIESIRESTGFLPGDDFKFRSASRPAQVSHKKHKVAKAEVMSACQDFGCTFIVHVVHHEVIKNQKPKQQVAWAADYVIGRYNLYLQEIDDCGICVMDNLPGKSKDGYQYLAEKFTRGLVLSGGNNLRLTRIKLLATSCNNASHASSAADIVLGSFRYCINEDKALGAALAMIPDVVRLLWHDRLKDGGCKTIGRGLIIRPPLDRVKRGYPKFHQDYVDLVDGINDLLKTCSTASAGA